MSTMLITIAKGIVTCCTAEIRGESFVGFSISSNVHIKLGVSSINSRVNNVNMTFSFLFDLMDLGLRGNLRSLGDSFELPLVVIVGDFGRYRWVVNMNRSITFKSVDTSLNF